ncbi:type II toxin-antitoxin system Phd/YefM family antitoxin [Persicirhabdus sediminis]|uniref:Antitoxin n=2 Tax=Persicirhabdus sediminis TaxID=454144 RepID=A0A8J7MH60_9BACT|nr:type II toxin-antitoxin system Phd/YefM family antitoxin [Persicirhabdus sediminis]
MIMKTMTVANLKAQFSEVLDAVRLGEEVVIEFGKMHEKVGVIVPYDKYYQAERQLGVLDKVASVEINDDFKMTDDELLGL